MNRKPSMVDRTVDRIMDLDSPAYGDERERTVFMESNAFGLTIGLFLGLISALVASLFGFLLLPVVLLIVTLLPPCAALWYAKRRGTDPQKLAENASTRSLMFTSLAIGGLMILTFAGMAFTVLTGHALLPVPTISVPSGDGAMAAGVRGAAIGGMVGGLVAFTLGIIKVRQIHRRRIHPAQ